MKINYLLLLVSVNFLVYSHASNTDVLNMVKPYLPDNPVIIDAGAYNGAESIGCLKVWPDATIHSFEPLPDNYRKLQEKTYSYPAIHTYPYALSNKNGDAVFNVSRHENPNKSGDQSSSLLAPKGHLTQWRDILFNEKITVKTFTIDEWAKQHGIDHVDFLWLDLQGMEYQVLSSAPDILETVKAVYTEINFTELYEGCLLYPVFKKWFEKNGFVEMYKHNTYGSFGDALFVRKELL